MKYRTDVEAVKMMRSGDKPAFRYFFNKYYDRLVAYIATYTRCKMQSEDIVQQAFINFWNDKLKLDDDKSPKSYLYAIAYNQYIDTVKREKKREKLFDQIWQRGLRDRIQEDTEAVELRIQKLRQVMESLPPKCKEIIQLNKVQGVKYKEIAEQKNISVKTVESQMRIAFTKIREAFKEDTLVLFLLFGKF